jgi:hypothetical protein
MQYRPNAGELLRGVADALESSVIPAVEPALQHTVRVAANLARICAREWELGPDAAAFEEAALAAVLGHSGDVAELQRELAQRVRTSDSDDFDREVWEMLMEVTRRDLSIAKPGYDDWEGG